MWNCTGSQCNYCRSVMYSSVVTWSCNKSCRGVLCTLQRCYCRYRQSINQNKFSAMCRKWRRENRPVLHCSNPVCSIRTPRREYSHYTRSVMKACTGDLVDVSLHCQLKLGAHYPGVRPGRPARASGPDVRAGRPGSVHRASERQCLLVWRSCVMTGRRSLNKFVEWWINLSRRRPTYL